MQIGLSSGSRTDISGRLQQIWNFFPNFRSIEAGFWRVCAELAGCGNCTEYSVSQSRQSRDEGNSVGDPSARLNKIGGLIADQLIPLAPSSDGSTKVISMARMVQRNLKLLAQQAFMRWFKEDQTNARQLRFEPLETRQLMASDFFASAGLAAEANGVNNYLGTNGAQVAAVTTQAEGEAGQDLVAFAKALKDAGVVIFGADWNPDTTAQLALFQDGAKFLDFKEVTTPQRTLNALGTAESISIYPTWQFQGTRRTGVLTLAEISTLSGIAIPTSSTPSIAPINNVTVLRGSPLTSQLMHTIRMGIP